MCFKSENEAAIASSRPVPCVNMLSTSESTRLPVHVSRLTGVVSAVRARGQRSRHVSRWRSYRRERRARWRGGPSRSSESSLRDAACETYRERQFFLRKKEEQNALRVGGENARDTPRERARVETHAALSLSLNTHDAPRSLLLFKTSAPPAHDALHSSQRVKAYEGGHHKGSSLTLSLPPVFSSSSRRVSCVSVAGRSVPAPLLRRSSCACPQP